MTPDRPAAAAPRPGGVGRGAAACGGGRASVWVLALVAVRAVAGGRRCWPARRRAALTALAMLGVASGVGVVALVRSEAVRVGPVATAAQQRALVTMTGTVTSDPRRIEGRFGDRVLVRVAVGRHQPVLVFGDDAWERVAIGERIRFTGRLAPVEDAGDLAATVTPRGPPETAAAAGPAWRATEALRASIRDAVAHRPASQRALVPALVDGDDAGMPPSLVEDFRTTGLTHLTAVSGTNLTLRGRVPAGGGSLGRGPWPLARRRRRGRDRRLRAAGPDRAERAARRRHGRRGAGRAGPGRPAPRRPRPRRGGGRAAAASSPAWRARRGSRSRCSRPRASCWSRRRGGTPWRAGCRAGSPRRSRCRWRPSWRARRWSPAISGQVSLVAVAANLVVAPVVGPATVLGLLGGRGRAWSRTCWAGWSAPWRAGASAWIVVVAEHGAALPGAALDWGTAPWSLAVLVAATAAVRGRGAGRPAPPHRRARPPACCSWSSPWPGRRRRAGRPPAGCSPPATSARATPWCCAPGAGSAVVVDAGPDPRAVDGCLRRLGVDRVPLLVLTHFHADHVDGLAGVLDAPRGGRGRGDPARRPARRRGGGRRRDGRRRTDDGGGGVRRDAHGRRRHAPGAVADAGSPTAGRATGARPTRPAWCCWPRSRACGCC